MPIALATAAPGGSTTLNWVHGDHLGTPIVITDATGIAIPQPGGYTTPAFPGQSRTLYDLYYNRYRDYDPSTGRYIQADPIGLAGGQSPYSYSMGNPLRYTDPSGLIIDTVFDIGFVLYDLYRIGADNIFGDDCIPGSLKTNLTALGLDIGAVFVPFVTGAGPASRVARNADDFLPTIKPGSRGGPSAGKRFPESVRRETKDADPTSTCVYCGRPGEGTQVDHAASRATGGNATPENAHLACPHCNSSKGAGNAPKNPPPGYVGPWPPLHWPR